MARQRKDTANPFLILLALALAAVAVIGPFLIAGWMVVCEHRAWRYRHASRPSQLITAQERAQVEACQAQVDHLEAQISELLNHGDNIGFQRRDADGLFDARNTGARDLNRRIEDLAYRRAEAQATLSATREPLAARMDGWTLARSRVVGARFALVTFVTGFIGILMVGAQDSGQALTLSGLMFGSGADGGERLLASGVATLAAGVAAWIGGSITRASIAA